MFLFLPQRLLYSLLNIQQFNMSQTGSTDLFVGNIASRTISRDLYLLFGKCGRVYRVFIPRDKRNGRRRDFAFVHYKQQDEAQLAVRELDGVVLNGRKIRVQFAQDGFNADEIDGGRVVESPSKLSSRSRSRNPRPRDEYRDRVHRRSRSRSISRESYHRYHERDRDYFRRSRSRNRERYKSDKHHENDRDYHRRGRSRSRERYERDKYHERDRDCHSRGRSRSRETYERDKLHQRDRDYHSRALIITNILREEAMMRSGEHK